LGGLRMNSRRQRSNRECSGGKGSNFCSHFGVAIRLGYGKNHGTPASATRGSATNSVGLLVIPNIPGRSQPAASPGPVDALRQKSTSQEFVTRGGAGRSRRGWSVISVTPAPAPPARKAYAVAARWHEAQKFGNLAWMRCWGCWLPGAVRVGLDRHVDP
jgi:hypothetical protein